MPEAANPSTGRALTIVGCCLLVLMVPFFVTALFRMPGGDIGFLVAPFACVAVGLVLRRVPRRGRVFSWSWFGGCAAYAVALAVLLFLFAAGGVPND